MRKPRPEAYGTQPVTFHVPHYTVVFMLPGALRAREARLFIHLGCVGDSACWRPKPKCVGRGEACQRRSRDAEEVVHL